MHWPCTFHFVPYSRSKLFDFYTLSQNELLENHTLHSGTYLKRLYLALINRARDLYGRILTEFLSTDRT